MLVYAFSQMLLEECQYPIKEKKVKNVINKESDKNESDESDKSNRINRVNRCSRSNRDLSLLLYDRSKACIIRQ